MVLQNRRLWFGRAEAWFYKVSNSVLKRAADLPGFTGLKPFEKGLLGWGLGLGVLVLEGLNCRFGGLGKRWT